MKNKKYIKHILIAAVSSTALIMSGCSEDFLKPDPLSFYEPSKTFTTKEGLESALATCDKHLRNMFSLGKCRWSSFHIRISLFGDGC